MWWFLVAWVAALGIAGAKLLGFIDWSWWIAAAPLWVLCVIGLVAGGFLVNLLDRRPPS